MRLDTKEILQIWLKDCKDDRNHNKESYGQLQLDASAIIEFRQGIETRNAYITKSIKIQVKR